MQTKNSAEVVLLKTSDFLALYTLPTFMHGHLLEVVPYFNLGKTIDHFFEIQDKCVKFEFNPLVVEKETLIDALQSYSSNQLSLRVEFVSQTKTENQGQRSNIHSPERDQICQVIIENFYDLEPGFKIAIESFGYSGHFYDFPIAWVD